MIAIRWNGRYIYLVDKWKKVESLMQSIKDYLLENKTYDDASNDYWAIRKYIYIYNKLLILYRSCDIMKFHIYFIIIWLLYPIYLIWLRNIPNKLQWNYVSIYSFRFLLYSFRNNFFLSKKRQVSFDFLIFNNFFCILDS
jgi:hypothetical protein